MPVNIDHPLVHTGHSWLWVCPQSPRAAPTEAFWEETQSCSWPHPGGSVKAGKKNVRMKEKEKCIELLKLTLCRALGGFTLPISPARTCCARGTSTSRLCPFRCTGEWRLPAFSYASLNLSSKRMHLRHALRWNCRAKRNTKRQRTSSNLCCCWKTNSTSGYYIKLASHVGARLYESTNKRPSDSACLLILFFDPM